MKISDKGIALIKSFEGLRLDAYKDPSGTWTIGYGHTQGVRKGDKITQNKADALLRQDLAQFEDCVNDVVTVKLTQNQFDALVSFAFNVGCYALAKSTLLKRLNASRYADAQEQFGRWVYAGKKKLNGLIRRRAAESKLFGTIEQPVFSADYKRGWNAALAYADAYFSALGKRLIEKNTL